MSIFRVQLKNNFMYEGKIINGKKNGFGKLFQGDKLLYEGMWIDDKTIDDIPLPTERKPNTNMENCQKLKFSYKPINEGEGEDFDLTYYVPFFSRYELKKVIDKAIKQTELTAEDRQITITVDNNTECDLTDCITKAAEIDDLAYYISSIDFNCSSCKEFNRGWTCCGQFAPFMYMYSFLLLEEGNYDRYKDKFGHTNIIKKPSQIYNIANVFYKIFMSYAMDDPKYIEHTQNVGDTYGIDIPNIGDHSNFWFDTATSLLGFHTDPNLLHFENNKSYLIILSNNDYNSHFCYIYRCNNYIIICDSWTHIYYERMPITRIMEYNKFINCITKINRLYKSYKRTNSIDDLLLYNFIMDSLFLVPYSAEHINEGQQSFSDKELSYIIVVDPNEIVGVLDTLVEESSPFNMYLELGGSKKKRKKTRVKNKKKNKKSKKVKRSYK